MLFKLESENQESPKALIESHNAYNSQVIQINDLIL